MKQKFERRTFIKTTTAAALGLTTAPYGINSLFGSGEPELVLVKKGQCRVPVIIPEYASEMTRQAASDLVEYIEKISGARPEILTQVKQVMKSAIWVGLHPQLSGAYPGLTGTFSHPEEILIACNGRHLVIAGRDSILSNTQIEYGTVNAVYTFLQKYLDVRWLWPGETGEDIICRDTIAIPSFEYRFHPSFLQRRLFIKAENNILSDNWIRLQRLKFDSLKGPAGGHAFTDWWERFHETKPELFALQPDGTRSGYPNPKNVKICMSNPEVWDQWLADAEDSLKKSPELNLLRAGENDGHSSGICVCENCRAWDNPEGQPWTYNYAGGKEEYVAITDRYITFINHLARKVKERFPDRDNLLVRLSAYGPSTPPPVEAVLDDNTILAYVGKFPTIDEETRQQQKAQLKEWARAAPNLLFRPNLFYWTGGAWAFPDTLLNNVMEDLRFLADNNCTGIIVDTAQEHWSTEGPQYYLMTQLTWDPYQDGNAVIADYYRRGFGKAAVKIINYWNLMEDACKKITASPGFGPYGRARFKLVTFLGQVYNFEFFHQAEALLSQAESLLADEPEIYRRRLGFVKTGFEFIKLMVANIPLMTRVRQSEGKDREAVKKVSENWEAIKKLCENAEPLAIQYKRVLSKMQTDAYMGMMEDYFGPPAEKFLNPGTIKENEKEDTEPDDID